MNEWARIADIVSSLATAAGIVLGGLWAYFKFIRGRTFASRVELTVAGSMFKGPSGRAVKATVSVKNTGLSKIALESDGKVVRLFGVPHSELSVAAGKQANISWQELMLTPVLEDHEWIEAQETVTDEVLLPVSGVGSSAGAHDEWMAFRLRGEILAAPRPLHRSGPAGQLTSSWPEISEFRASPQIGTPRGSILKVSQMSLGRNGLVGEENEMPAKKRSTQKDLRKLKQDLKKQQERDQRKKQPAEKATKKD